MSSTVHARHTQAHVLPNKKIEFMHLPIVDGSVTRDELVNRFCDQLVGKVLGGKKLYVHCWGGHGRTGTVIAVMLGRLYDVTAAQALERTQQLHDIRGDPQNVGSPSTRTQVAQVFRLLAARRNWSDGSRRAASPSETPADPVEAAENETKKLELERVRTEKLRRRDREREVAIERIQKREFELKTEFQRTREYAGVRAPRTPSLVQPAGGGLKNNNGDAARRWR